MTFPDYPPADPPTVIASLHRDVVDHVTRELRARYPMPLGVADASAAFFGFDVWGFLEKAARDAIDGIAEALGPGAEAKLAADREMIRRFVGESTLEHLDRLLHVVMDIRAKAPPADAAP